MALLIPLLRCFLKAGTCVLPRVQAPLLTFQAAKPRSPYGRQKEFTDTIFYKLCENEEQSLFNPANLMGGDSSYLLISLFDKCYHI